MKKNKKNTARLLMQKIVRFLKVQLWLQKIRIKAIGAWYFFELGYIIIDRLHPLINSYIFALIINEVIRLSTQQTKDISTVVNYAIITIVLNLVMRSLLLIYNRTRSYKIDRPLDYYLEDLLRDKLLELNWEHIETPEGEKKIQMSTSRSWSRILNSGRDQFEFIAFFITTIAALVSISVPPFLLFLILFSASTTAALDLANMRNMLKHDDLHQATRFRLQSLFSYFRNLGNLLEIKITAVHANFTYLQEQLRKVHNDSLKGFLNKTNPYYGINAIITISANTYITFYYLFKVIYSGMQIGTYNFTTTALFNVGNNLGGMFNRASRLLENYRYVTYFYDLLNIQNKIPNGKLQLTTDTINIEFKNVWFKYPASKKWAIKDLSFTINDNERLAIVGENGAGKSTFLKLLTLAYYPTKGSIEINGHDLKEYDKESLYKKISLVAQDFSRYGSQGVTNNIAIYGDYRNIDQKRLRLAAKLATVSDFVEKLPAQYDTPLTKSVDGGTELSTGQWQRIAVARQFYSDRPLVILDEPTSAIDPIAEATIFSNLYHHVKNKTVVVVSHRYNTVKAASKIIVFKDGQIIEQGSHKSLVELDGYYAKAYNVQNEEKKL
jgi:ABC-type bacteriocin/lantibiotic exporter with double-glycine peptidase domain